MFRMTMLTFDILRRFEQEYKTDCYNDDERSTIETDARIAMMNRHYHNEQGENWTDDDIYADFLRCLAIDKINLIPAEPEQSETETAEADETETNEQESDIMHEADMEAIEGGYSAAKKFEAAGRRLKEILGDPTQHRYLNRAQEQYITAARRYDAWCDLQDALKEIDRHGYCYLLALLIIKYGKADQIVRFIMRKAKSICEDEHITLYNNPRIAPQTITMWAINQYGGLLTQADMDSAIAWRKQCLTIRPKKGV